MDCSDPLQDLLQTEETPSEMAKECARRSEAGAGEQLQGAGQPTHFWLIRGLKFSPIG